MRTVSLAFVFTLAFLCLAACQAAAAPTETVTITVFPTAIPEPTMTSTPPFDLDIHIDLDQPRQTIRDLGAGNFIHYFSGMDDRIDPVGSYNLEHLPLRHARVGIELQLWEPENDNADPLTIAAAGFRDEGVTHNTFLFMQDLQAKGVEITASIWRVPNWLVSNPYKDRERIIPPEMYAEAIESIAQWLLTARDTYGVEVAYVSFNESNIGINVYWMPPEYIEFIRAAGRRFAELGITTRWLLGDTSNIGDTAWYVAAIYAAEDIRPYLGPLAFHSWDANALDDTIQRIATLAEKNGLTVYCTEAGWDPFLWRTPERFPTWENALNLARIYARVIKLSRAEVLMYWEMLGRDYYLNDGAQPFPAFTILQQLAQAVPTGSVVLTTSPDRDGVYSFAARHPDGGLAVYLVNTNPAAKQVLLTGLPDARFSHIRSSATERNQPVGWRLVEDGRLWLELTAGSVNLLATDEH